MSNITQMNTTKTVNIFRPDGLSQRSNADIAVGKEAYENITIADMRASILDNIDATITAIDEYDGWSVRKFSEAPLVSPLAKRVRTGVQVKIGYGAKNETLEFKGMPEGHSLFEKFGVNRKVNNVSIAIGYLDNIKAGFEDGTLDYVLERKLAVYKRKSKAGGEATAEGSAA